MVLVRSINTRTTDDEDGDDDGGIKLIKVRHRRSRVYTAEFSVYSGVRR